MGYDFSQIKVLVVEDNQPMLELVKSVLKSFGVGQILSARHGKQGIEKICEENPDLIIADWMMKPMDGIELTEHVRRTPDIPNNFVPIILMTGFSEMKRVIEARDAGVTEFLVKPFNARELYRRIAQVIEKPRRYVRSEDFFGPDRRRRKPPKGYNGPFLRDTDVRPEDYEIAFNDSRNLSEKDDPW